MGPSLLILLALTSAPAPCVGEADGRRFPTCFDPGERLEVGVGGGYGTQAAAGRISGALRLRKSRRSRTDEGLLWTRDHTLGEVELELPGLRLDAARFEGVAYQGVFVRRYEEGALVLQGLGWRVPFPFDVGLGVEVGRFAYARGTPDQARLDVVRAALLLDAARRLPGAWRFAFGPELGYGLGLARDGAPRHLVQPFSGGVLQARFETEDGLFVAHARGRAGWELEVGGASGLRWDAALDVERTILAVDDRPLAPYLRLSAASGANGQPPRLTAELGLRLAAPL